MYTPRPVRVNLLSDILFQYICGAIEKVPPWSKLAFADLSTIRRTIPEFTQNACHSSIYLTLELLVRNGFLNTVHAISIN